MVADVGTMVLITIFAAGYGGGTSDWRLILLQGGSLIGVLRLGMLGGGEVTLRCVLQALGVGEQELRHPDRQYAAIDPGAAGDGRERGCSDHVG